MDEQNVSLLLRKKEAQDRGKAIGAALTDALNTYNYEKDLVQGFIEGVVGSHRTLQQSTMRALYALILKWAEMYEKGYYDPRNEKTVKFCKQIKDMAENEKVYFPFV